MRIIVAVLLTLAALPAHAGTTLSQGLELLRTFEAQLKTRDSENRALIATLDRLLQAYETLAPDPPQKDISAAMKRAHAKRFATAAKSFRRKTEAALLRGVKVKLVDRDLKRNERHAVNVRAVQALRRTRPAVAKRIRHLLEHTIIKDRDYEPYGVFYDEAFATLVFLDPDGSFEWLLEECVTTDIRPGPKDRTLSALEALMNIRNVPGKKRRRVVQKIVFQWESVESQALFNDYGDNVEAKRARNIAPPMLRFWLDVRHAILAAMRHFGTDPRTGAVPLRPRTGMPMNRIVDYTRWYSHHKRLERSPWLDPKRGSYMTPHTRARAAGVTIGRDHLLPWWTWWLHNRETRRTRHGTAPRSAAVTGKRPSFRRSRVRKRIIPVLRKAMAVDEDPEVRAAAAIALGRLKAGEAKAELLFLLHDDRSPAVREAAALGLVGLQEESVRSRLEELARNRKEGRYLRAYAVLGLAPIDTGAFKGSKPVLADLSAYAVLGAGLRADADVAFDLASLLGQRRAPADARGQVGPALARLGNRDVVAVLHDFLRKKKKGRKRELSAPAVGVAIAMGALIEKEDGNAIELIARVSRKPKEWSPAARAHFVIALGRIGGKLAYERLLEGFHDAGKDRRQYAETGYYLLAAALTGRKEARGFVRSQFLELKHEGDLAACAIALALMGDKEMVAQLRTKLEASKNEFVPHGMMALAMLGDKETLPLIRHFVTHHRGPRVFSEGVLALAILRGSEGLPRLLKLFEWARSRDRFRAVGRAISLVESEEAVARLLAIHADATRPPEQRAAALDALGRIGAGEGNLFSKIARDVNMHATSPTLPALAMLR